MSKKIFGLSFVLFAVFVFGSFITPNVALATRNASVTISPTTAFTGQNQIYTYTVTNTNDGTTVAGIGSVEIQLPTGFGTPSISILSASASKVWVLGSSGGYVNGFNSSNGKIGVKADVGSGVDSDKLVLNEFVEIQITTTAPSTANTYEWTASVWAGLGFDGNPPFTVTSSQPTVIVTASADATPPVITLTGASTINLNVGDTYTEQNATATDDIDSSITVVTTGTVDTTTAGTYTVHYNASDIAGNHAIEVIRTITVTSVASGSAPTHLNIETNVDVPASCNATDTNGLVHNYPTSSSYLAICALEAAINNGAIFGTQLSNQYPSLGLFITSINNVAADPNSQYWAIYQNGGFANSGITSLPVIAGDVIMFQLHDFSDNNLGDQVTLHIHSLVSNTPTGSGGLGTFSDTSSNTTPSISTFDVQKALAYLKSVQGSDGSFVSDLYTDWAGIAYGAGGVTGNSRNTLLSYLSSHNTVSSLLTDNERRAMTLMALGQNPYSFGGVSYINAIINSFDGTQFGDAHLANDDVFALIPLSSAGYTASDEIITKDIAFIISAQQTNGSWDASIDMTAATIQALKIFDSVSGVSNSISKGADYIKNAQNNDGGWGSVYSTSWAMQAMSALSASWSKGGHTPMDYLATQQKGDGAMLPSSDTLTNRIWATSYAIGAQLGKSWSAIMQHFPKPTITNNSTNNSLTSVTETTNTVTLTNTNNPPTNLEPKATLTPDIVSPKIAVNTTKEKQNNKSLSKNKSKVSENKIALSPKNSDTVKITGSALTGTAVNALPKESGTSKTAPVVLGAVSGVFILYILTKLLLFL